MKYYFTLLSFVFLVTSSVFSQEKVVKYTISSGETINQIAQKFKITPYDIYQLNPDARGGLVPNTVLLIPTKSGKTEPAAAKTNTSGKAITHEVQPKETLFGIEKKIWRF
jgi:methionine-rich copper-binding protein CopC